MNFFISNAYAQSAGQPGGGLRQPHGPGGQRPAGHAVAQAPALRSPRRSRPGRSRPPVQRAAHHPGPGGPRGAAGPVHPGHPGLPSSYGLLGNPSGNLNRIKLSFVLKDLFTGMV